MKLNKKNKIKIFTFILLSLFLVSSLFQSTQNVFAEPNHQDDNDLEATLHSRLVSSSGEFASSLMPTGTYAFYETPQLDIGSFSHDLTYIDIDDLQYPISTNTSTKNYNFTNLSGNQTIESPELPEYDLSSPEDTIIETIIDYDTNVSEFDFIDSYSLDLQDPDLESIYYDGSNWWFLGTNTKRVYRYDDSFTYTGHHHYLGAEDSAPKGIHKEGSYWYVLGTTNDKIYKYDSDWVYTDTSYDINLQDTDAVDIYFDGSYWYLVGDGNNRVYKYSSSWVYSSTSYDISAQDTSPKDICYYENYFWLLGDQNDKIYRYNSSWSYTLGFTDISSQDNQPQSMFLVDDYIWISGSQNDEIYKYYIGNRWSYTGSSYYVGDQDGVPISIHFDGTYWWMLGVITKYVYKYNSDWSYTGSSYYVGGQDNNPVDIYFYDSNWYMVGDLNNRIYKYSSSWSYTGSSYYIGDQDGAPTSIHKEGSYWYLVGDQNNRIYKYNSDWSYTDTSYYVGDQDGGPTSIYFDGSYWYLVGIYTDYVYKYSSSWSYTGSSYYVGDQDSDPTSIHFDGTYWWMLGLNNKRVYNYDMEWSYADVSYNDDFILNFKSVYWDGTYWYVLESNSAVVYKYDSTWTYTESFYDISSQDSNPKGIYFYNNYWYVVGDTNNRIYKYTSSWTYTYSSYDISSEDTSPRDICYYNSYWYLIGDGNNRVYKYTSDWSYTDTSYDISSQDTSPSGIFYYNSYWYLVGDANNRIYKYDVSFSYTEYSYNISSEDTSPTGLFYTDDYWYLIGDSNDKIFEYFAIEFFSSVWVINFTYQISGMDYYEDYELSYDDSNSIKDGINKNGTLVYYFDSSFFSQYDYITNIKVLEQNLTLVFNNIYDVDQVNFSLVINWSSNTWRVPTEVDLTINGNSVIDESDRSGYVYLSTFPNTLTITASHNVYFKLNITCYFTFTFDLNIVSKTYLRNDFKLLSDHSIFIDSIALDSDLNIKKIYLNDIDLGSSNPNYLSPAMQMDQNNIFNLEIILADELYRQLPYDDFRLIFSELFGTSTPYMGHSFYPDDHNSIYSINNELYMMNQYPNEFQDEDWSSWNMDHDSDYTGGSFNDGDFSSWLNNGSEYGYPLFYNVESGYHNNSDGTLLSADSDYAKFLSESEGIYNAEYNFANEPDGEEGLDIGFVDSATIPNDCSVEISPELDGHKKILNITHDGGASDPCISHNFPDGIEITGTREFWWGTNNNNQNQDFQFRSSSTIAISLVIKGGNFTHWDGVWHDTGVSATNSKLFHHKIVFDCDTDTFDWYINGVLVFDDQPFRYVVDTIDRIYIQNFGNDAYSQYLDAFDRPEADGYTSGRNKEPIFYFGNYPATYSFDNEEVWTKGTDIGFVDSATIPNDCSVEIVYEIDEHRKILKIEHDGGASDPSMQHNLASTQITGVVEFWWGTSDNTQRQQFSIYDATTGAIRLFIEAGKFQYETGGYQDTGVVPTNNTLFHHKIVFDCDTDTFDWYIDGILRVDDGAFYSVSTGLTRIHCAMKFNAVYSSYFDAFAYSFDPDYAIGDNYYFQYFKGTHPFEKYNLSTYENYYGTYDFEDYSLYDEYGNYTAEHGFDLETEAGYYKGSGGFNYETIGDKVSLDEINWVDGKNLYNGEAEIIAEWQNHKNILRLQDDVDVGEDPEIWHNVLQSTSGTFEHYIGTNDVTEVWVLEIKEGATHIVRMKIETSKLQYINSASSWADVQAVANDTLYHIKIIWKATDKFDCYVDGVLKLDDIAMSYNNTQTSGVDTFKIYAYGDSTDYLYIDAPGLVGETDPEGYTYHPSWNVNPYNFDKLLDAGHGMDSYHPGYPIMNYSISVEDSLDGHSNIIKIIDSDAATYRGVDFYTYFGSSKTSGTVEFWIYITDYDANGIYISLSVGTNINNVQLLICIDADKIYNALGSGNVEITSGFTLNNWHHIRIDFDCDTDTFSLYLNGTLGGSDLPFRTACASLYYIFFNTGYWSETTFYVDALDFSWSPNYVPYGNSNPYGQLLELENDGWEFYYKPYTSVSIIYESSAHNKIMNITDNSAVNFPEIKKTFTQQTTGIIELWFKTTDSNEYFSYKIRGGSTGANLKLTNGELLYYNGSDWNKIMDVLNNTWYHWSIDFNTDTDTFDFYINGVLQDSGDYGFENSISYLNEIAFRTTTTTLYYSIFLNGLAYSWDPDYSVGQNTNPYYEDLRDTGFVDDWTINYAYNCWINISGEYGQHKKYVELYDNSVGGWVILQIPFTDQTYGTFELYMRSSDVTYVSQISLRLGGTDLFALEIDSDKFQYYDGSWHDVGLNASDDIWYHVRIVFECGDGGYEGLAQYDWKIEIDGSEYGDYDFNSNQPHADIIRIHTSSADSDYYIDIDSLSYSWEDPIGINLKCDQRVELNFTAPIDLTFYSNDTIEDLFIYYAYKTDIYQNINFYAYNFITSSFTLINSSANNISFYELNYGLNFNNYLNATHHCILKFYGYNNTYGQGFELYTDVLNAGCNWTKTSGNLHAEITKSISFAFLNRYDVGFDDYKLLYDIDLTLRYKYSNYTQYSEYANLNYDGNDYTLIKDESWHEIVLNFEFDSTSVSGYDVIFNITNGLLEMSGMNYTIRFKCLDSDNNIKMYQEFILDCNLNLEDYQERYLDFILNFTVVSFNPADDYSDLSDDTDYSSLKYIINMTTESNYVYYNYTSNSSISSQVISMNLRNLLTDDNKYYLNNLNLHFLVAGNNSHIYLDNVYIYTENQYSIQKSVNPRTDIDSVEFCYYYQADREYDYWYVEDSYTVNDIDMIHESSGTAISPIEMENSKYYFGHDTNLDDEFNSTVDYNPNWDVGFTYVINNASYSYVKVEYSADFIIYDVVMILDLRNTMIFDDTINQNRDDYVLTIESLDFTASTKTLYITGTRTQYTSNPQTDLDLIQMNETITYNGDVLTTSLVDNDPNWQISTSIIEKNATYGKMKIDYRADMTYTNVDLKTTITRNEMYADTVEVKGYQNTTTLAFELSAITFMSIFQTTYIEGFRYLDEAGIMTNMSYVDYEERYYWNSNSLSNHSIEIRPDWVILSSVVEYNGTYAKIEVQYKSDIAINDVILQFSRTRNNIFSDIYELYGEQHITTIEFSLSNVNFTTSSQIIYINCYRTLLETSITTDEVYLDFNEEYKWDETSLSNYSIEINPNWDVLITFENRTGLYTDIKVEYESDLLLNNIELKFSLARNIIFGDIIEIAGYQNTTIIEFMLQNMNFTTSYQTTYIEGFRTLLETDITTDEIYLDFNEEYKWNTDSLSNYSIEIKPNWQINTIVENNGTYAEVQVDFKADLLLSNIDLKFSLTRDIIFDDSIEIAGYQNITEIDFSLLNVNFTSLYQTTYIECFRSLTQINPNTNMTYLDFEEQYYWNSTSLSNHSIQINPNWNVGYSIISNNGTFTQLNISYYSDLCLSNILLKLNLKSDDLYAENWSNNAQQSIYTYILEISNINFTTSEQILNLTGVSSVPYCNFSSFINEDGFKLSDEEWRIKITDEEWRTITKSNWEDIEVYMYGYVQFTKYSRVFIISDIEAGWELDGVHYQGIPYDISATGYFTCEGWGSGITSAYLRFKTNPIENLRREQTREQVIYKIKSKYDLEDVDFIFYIEEDERYNINDMIKQLKKEIDCTDIIKYYSVEDRDYYMIMDMNLDEGTNKITIYYKIENAAKYSWAFLIVGIAMIGFSIIYISYRYYDNKILDFIGLDKLVKYFFWIKKSERIKMTKKYRLNKKKKKRGKK